MLNGTHDDLIPILSPRRGIAAVGLAILAGVAILMPLSIDIPAPRSFAVQVCGWTFAIYLSWIVPTKIDRWTIGICEVLGEGHVHTH